MPAAIATATVAPGGPKRSAAQMSPGKTMYVRGCSAASATTLSPATVASISPPSTTQRFRTENARGFAHAIASGITTRPPETPPSHQLRQNAPISGGWMTSPIVRESIATLALMASPTATATPTAATCSRRFIRARGPMRRRRMTAATIALAKFPAVSASATPSGSWANSLERRSPSRTPGHHRSPPR